MMFKNSKERPHWIFALLYLVLAFNRLIEWDFEVNKWSRKMLLVAIIVLIGVHIHVAIKWRRKGNLPSE